MLPVLVLAAASTGLRQSELRLVVGHFKDPEGNLIGVFGLR